MFTRRTIKQLAESSLGTAPARLVARRRHRGARLVLAYHNVLRPGAESAGDRPLHMPFDDFRRQMDLLTAHRLEVVSIGDPLPHSDGPPQVAITFDDACAGALELAVPELAERRFAATVFVAPGLLGLDAPWWDLLASPIDGTVPSARREYALSECHGLGEAVLREAAARDWVMNPRLDSFRIGDEDSIARALARHPRLTLGAHTWSHANLASLDGEALHRELDTTLPWLRDRWPERTVPWLAYPYGLHSDSARRAAAQAEFRGGFLINGGWHRAPLADPFAIPRLHVSARLSESGFAARVAGLFPVA